MPTRRMGDSAVLWAGLMLAAAGLCVNHLSAAGSSRPTSSVLPALGPRSVHPNAITAEVAPAAAPAAGVTSVSAAAPPPARPNVAPARRPARRPEATSQNRIAIPSVG